MRKKIISPASIAIIVALLAIIGISACKARHQTKYGPPPVDYNEPAPQTKYGVPAPTN